MTPDLTNLVSQTVRDQVDAATRRIDFLLTGVVVVLFIAFITILVTVLGLVLDSQRFKSETYQNLVNQVSATNAKLEILMAQQLQKNFTP